MAVSRGSSAIQRWDLATGAPIGESLPSEITFAGGLTVAQLDGRPVFVYGENENVRVPDLRSGEPVGAAFPPRRRATS